MMMLDLLALLFTLLAGVEPDAAAFPGLPDIADGSSCVEGGATGFYTVAHSTLGREYVYIVDADDDGLPEEAWCPGTPTGSNLRYDTLANGGSTAVQTCAAGIATNQLTTDNGCAFTIDLWVGSDVEDDDGAGRPVDCSANGNPVMMFGTLAALASDATWIELDKTDPDHDVTTATIGRASADWGHTQAGYHMAFDDDPDGGFYLALTADPNPKATDTTGYGAFSTLDASSRCRRSAPGGRCQWRTTSARSTSGSTRSR